MMDLLIYDMRNIIGLITEQMNLLDERNMWIELKVSDHLRKEDLQSLMVWSEKNLYYTLKKQSLDLIVDWHMKIYINSYWKC